MDKKTIIIIVALGILVIAWIPIMTFLGFIEPAPTPPPVDSTLATEQPIQSDMTPNPVTNSGNNETQTQPVTPAQTSLEQQDTLNFAPEMLVTVETNVQKFILSNYGGAPVSILLKKYLYEDGQEIEMLPDNKVATPEINFNDRAISGSQFAFTPSNPQEYYTLNTGDMELTYVYDNNAGGVLKKKYRFYADRHDFDLIIEVDNKASFGFEREFSLEWNNKLAPTELGIQDDYNSMWVLARQGSERVKYDDYDNNQFRQSNDGETYWTATRSKYFTALLIPRSRIANGVMASGLKRNVGEIETRELTTGLTMNMPTDQNFTDSFTVYVGPMDYEVLKNYDNEVVDLLDIGTTPVIGWLIKIFAIPILWLLPRMYEFIPNYGVVILLFGLLVKVITWPLTRKTIASMSAMKDLQPQMKELQEKHKNNPQALNKEMMKLYKEAGVNPFSGCLPFLPQMPLFFALFAVFRSTILLRQAPFVLWYTDLSRGAMSFTDPYIVLVVVMMILMFLQQKMTPMSGQQQNKALMYIFPFMLGFFFYKAAAGLIIYWTSFSLFSFLEQLIFRRRSKPVVTTEIKKA